MKTLLLCVIIILYGCLTLLGQSGGGLFNRGGSHHPNARYNIKKFRHGKGGYQNIPDNQIMINAGNLLVNEVQLTYLRNLGNRIQPFVSAGWIRKFNLEISDPTFWFTGHYPFWSKCMGYSLAMGVNFLKKSGQATDYWGITLMYRNMSFQNEIIKYSIDPKTGQSVGSESNEIITRQNFQRHVFGIKVLNGVQFPRKKQTLIRGQAWWGVGFRVRLNYHDYLSVDNPRNRFQNYEPDIKLDFLPTIHLGINLGFGW